MVQTREHPGPEEMHTEDLAALEDVTEDTVLYELQERNKKGQNYTFIGDILLFLNPNVEQDIYGLEVSTSVCSYGEIEILSGLLHHVKLMKKA